ncbi:hypothetical protein IPJ72_05260 [Candidatus Peregrinibacteria bacterium]|nr:MAG: hypothetical protein IPJ72_05260 [Candidatus Peregrinibacteria bacterium]
MFKRLLSPLRNQSGVTFIELLLYVAIFLVITPTLLTVSINSVRFDRQHEGEKQTNADAQFVIERMYNLISGATRVNVADSVFDMADGRLSMLDANDQVVVIQVDTANNTIEITEGG